MNEIANLTKIQPFPDATNETSIYVATKVESTAAAEFEKTNYEVWNSRGLVRINPTTDLGAVLESVDIRKGVACPVYEWGSPLWTGIAEEFKEAQGLRGSSEYLASAHRGTISDLARVYWVKVEKYSATTNRALIRTLTEVELPIATLVDPVDGAWIEADLLYPLIRGRDLGRYSVATNNWYQIIPNKHYEDVESEDQFAEKYPCAYSYFSNYRDRLLNRSTYKRYQRHLPFYAIYCVGDYSFAKWKIGWMEQQDPTAFRCAVISETSKSLVPNKTSVPDHKLYMADLSSKEEAHFLCGYLNSHPVRTWLGGFLHGKQIGTSIFQFMRVPQFDKENSDHGEIAAISLEAHRTRARGRSTKVLDPAVEEKLAVLVKRISR